jgi:microtubule-associated protein, RP/EB family
MNESIGMLAEAYFASRSTILQWLNSLLGLNYTKIEQTASGVAVCQIFDALFPDTVRLDKVNFQAKREYEYIQNYKVLQAAYNRVGIEKKVDVEKLIKGKYQDNLEFMQWVKGFFDQHASDAALQYDGAARRAQLGRTGPGARGGTAPQVSRQGVAPVSKPVVHSRKPTSTRPATLIRRDNAKENSTAHAESVVKQSELDALQLQVDELNQVIEEGDAEREFYFSKLRNIEIVIQSIEDENPDTPLDPILQQIKDILYMTEDDAAANTESLEAGVDVGPADGLVSDVAAELYPGKAPALEIAPSP